MKKWMLLMSLAAALCAPVSLAQEPKHENETALSGRYCILLGGVAEFRLADEARADCLTSEWAIEVDFTTSKVYECLGQSAYYGAETGRQAVCVLMWRDDEQSVADFQKYTRRALVASTLMDVQVWCVKTTTLGYVDCATGEDL